MARARINTESLRAGTQRSAARTVNTRHQLRPLSEYPAGDDEIDKLHIPRHMIPEGFDLQWVADSVYGKPEPQRRARFERKGWEPVHQEDFGNRFDGKWMSEGKEGEINYDGLVLMARPIQWSQKARDEERRKAQLQVRIKEQQIKGGDMPGVTLDTQHPTALNFNTVHKEVERLNVPQD